MKKYFTLLSLTAITLVSCFDTPKPNKINPSNSSSNINEDELLKPYIEAFMKEREIQCPGIKTTDTDKFTIKQRAIWYITESQSSYRELTPLTTSLTPQNMVKLYRGEEFDQNSSPLEGKAEEAGAAAVARDEEAVKRGFIEYRKNIFCNLFSF